MRETLKLFKTLEKSRDDFNVLDGFYQDLVTKVKNLVALAP